MKWFMATNEASIQRDSFYDLMKVALFSGMEHGGLEPYLIVHGEDCSRLDWFRERGVTVFFEDVELLDTIKSYYQIENPVTSMDIRAGAYLKTQIPRVARRHGITDERVLYTDCDVLFVKKVDWDAFRPKWLGMSGRKVGSRTRLKLGGSWHFNSGVTMMNIKNMIKEADQFNDFVKANGGSVKRPKNQPFMQKNLVMSDQVALNLFYKGRIESLPQEVNWNPQRGYNDKAKIVHFNGLKWTDWNRFQNNELAPFRMDKFSKQVEKSEGAYEHYVKQAKEVRRRC